jgi:hypothetical protein
MLVFEVTALRESTILVSAGAHLLQKEKDGVVRNLPGHGLSEAA